MDPTTPSSFRSTPTRPLLLSRSQTAPTKRPSTSDGVVPMEYKSDLLRERMQQRKANHGSPRRPSTGTKDPQPSVDDWAAAAEGSRPGSPDLGRPAGRPQRTMSQTNGTRPSLVRTPTTTKEVNEYVDKTANKIWDLQHRIILIDEQNKKLSTLLEESQEKSEACQDRIDELEEEKSDLKLQISTLEMDKQAVNEENTKLAITQEALAAKLEQRDAALTEACDRLDTMEAANKMLEEKIEMLERSSARLQSSSSSQHDSDYYSAETDTPRRRPSKSVPKHIMTTPGNTRPSVVGTPFDSDYFSASEASPLGTPKTPRQLSHELSQVINGAVQPPPASIFTPARLSLATHQSIDSMSSIDLHPGLLVPTPSIPEPKPMPRGLIRRARTPALDAAANITPRSLPPRPLRDLYVASESEGYRSSPMEPKGLQQSSRASVSPPQRSMRSTTAPPPRKTRFGPPPSPAVARPDTARRNSLLDNQKPGNKVISTSSNGSNSSTATQVPFNQTQTRPTQTRRNSLQTTYEASERSGPTEIQSFTAGNLPSEASSFAPRKPGSAHRFTPWPPSLNINQRERERVHRGDMFFSHSKNEDLGDASKAEEGNTSPSRWDREYAAQRTRRR
ncbi:hypothetical protein K402DRAFT_388395 [Aulographum hederae CBS 113979]|uniref:Centrosomin N-terminal motif 1 domain-containing protein n=1 Tax=Aulographum hederae CBS 113979 TaxID=1176131 RepID=A0A6G1HFK3_9PEZI|nr:hypothetical protein K402DRAFT_388395 [Aulographum hederae CBS 113979]